jgi:hypothetical protein
MESGDTLQIERSAQALEHGKRLTAAEVIKDRDVCVAPHGRPTPFLSSLSFAWRICPSGCWGYIGQPELDVLWTRTK